MRIARILSALFFCLHSSGEDPRCEPDAALRAEIAGAAAAPVDETRPFDEKMASFRKLREAHPGDLFAQMAWQDAIEEHGVQGAITAMVAEYQRAAAEKADSLFDLYLFGRALAGIVTPQAVAILNGVLEKDPGYAPAHRSLAEIYSSKAFRDPEKERLERAKFLALCPGSSIASRPNAPPASPLLDQARALLKAGRGLNRIPAMVDDAMRQNNWRLQHIRPFDWYSVEEKKEAGREVAKAYWTGWALLAAVYTKSGDGEKAERQIAEMRQRFLGQLRDRDETWWYGGGLVVELLARNRQPEQAREALDAMAAFAAEHPGPERAARLEELRRLAGAPAR